MFIQRPLTQKSLTNIVIQLTNFIQSWNIADPQDLKNIRINAPTDPVKELNKIASILKNLRITAL